LYLVPAGWKISANFLRSHDQQPGCCDHSGHGYPPEWILSMNLSATFSGDIADPHASDS
jgi:aspartokinase-like uncharacterized kinase